MLLLGSPGLLRLFSYLTLFCAKGEDIGLEFVPADLPAPKYATQARGETDRTATDTH
jgi:hypothetical protein